MLRVPVRSSDVLVGKPLPWDIFDTQGNLLLSRGRILESNEEKVRLLQRGAERDIDLDEHQRRSAEAIRKLTRFEQDSSNAQTQGAESLHFEGLRLQPGESLQLQVGRDERRFNVRFIGSLKGRSLIVSNPEAEGTPVFVADGSALTVSGIASQLAFVFKCSVLVNSSRPYPHLHLSYPPEVRGMRLRQTERVPVHVATAIQRENGESSSGAIIDLSLGGVHLISRIQLKLQERIVLKFKIQLAGQPMIVTENGIVRAERPGDTKSVPGGRGYGVQFVDMPPEDLLLLMHYISTLN